MLCAKSLRRSGEMACTTSLLQAGAAPEPVTAAAVAQTRALRGARSVAGCSPTSSSCRTNMQSLAMGDARSRHQLYGPRASHDTDAATADRQLDFTLVPRAS